MTDFTVILNAHGVGVNRSITPDWRNSNGDPIPQPTLSVGNTVLVNCFTAPYKHSMSTYKDLGVAASIGEYNNSDLKTKLSQHETANNTVYLYGITKNSKSTEANDVFNNAVPYSSTVFNAKGDFANRVTSLTMTFDPNQALKNSGNGVLYIEFSFGDPHVEGCEIKVKW